MNKYECIYVARQDIPPTQVENMSEQFTGIIKEYNGNIQKVEYCGLRQLAYKIKKNRKGHYVEMHLEAAPDAIIEMERQMGLHEDMLRFLTLRVKEFAKGPSPLSQTKGYKESRRAASTVVAKEDEAKEGETA